MNTPTKANAKKIADLLSEATTSLLSAELAIRAAHDAAVHDYEGNDAQIRDLLGAAAVLHTAVITQGSMWRAYERARDSK